MNILEELEKKGFQVTYEKGLVYRVVFPLTPEEWCALCMRDGECYMGGCCGQTGVIQDRFNAIFRDSGAVDASDMLGMMQAASKHDGFEEYSLEWSGNLEELVGKWDELGPVQKIGICCQAVKDKLVSNSWIPSGKGKAGPEDWCRILRHSLEQMAWRDLICTEGDKGQKHANHEELLSRIVPACQKVLQEAVPRLAKPFKGFAVVKGGTKEIQADANGLCIYAKEKIARIMVEKWKKAANKEELPHIEKLEVKSVTVDAHKGILWK